MIGFHFFSSQTELVLTENPFVAQSQVHNKHAILENLAIHTIDCDLFNLLLSLLNLSIIWLDIFAHRSSFSPHFQF